MSKKPNILWIMADQHNANCMSIAGHPNVKTPTLDSIAQQGVLHMDSGDDTDLR